VFPLVLVGITVNALGVPGAASALFLALSSVLSWNALLPGWNPFERAYNRFLAARRGLPPLTPAPGPRRFAQAMAAAFLLGSALTLLAGAALVSGVFQALLVVAFTALLFGRFCLGAYVYHMLRGRMAFANATLPWARPRA
jgi:hypothetical protein